MEGLRTCAFSVHASSSPGLNSGRARFVWRLEFNGKRSQLWALGRDFPRPPDDRKRSAMVIRAQRRGGQPGVSRQQGVGEKLAWLGGIFPKSQTEEEKKKAMEKLLVDMRAAKLTEGMETQRLIRMAEVQAERNFMQMTMWKKTILRLQGKLKGTAWDPEPSYPIAFSEFWKLLEGQQVTFLEYAEHGKDIAVVLPYYNNGESLTVQSEDGSHPKASNEEKEIQPTGPNEETEIHPTVPKEEREIVYKRHHVSQMPADAWGDIWPKLRQQVQHVEIKHPNSIPTLLYPTLETVVIWAMRLALAVVLYKCIRDKLEPIYRPRSRADRPVLKRPKLSASGSMDLGSLGQSRARFISAEESTGVTFDDFAGQEYVKRELKEVVKILKSSKEFQELGIYCPKGVMLYGPPGTGKTLLAKAIAGEAGVPFFSASGSEFVEMFVGVAAARVRDLFARARQFAPSIIFIDEIDAIGAKRGGPDIGGGGIEREQGLIQILTELDGFQSSQAQVMVVGATNRLDMLDPALLRKGRFDKTISIGLPQEEGRLAILQVHARNKGFKSEKEKEELLKVVASVTQDFSGAELQNVLNEAAILAARKDKDIIEKHELDLALERQEGTFSTGEEDAVDTSGEARLRIAYREAAIAVLECYYPNPSRPILQTNIRDIDTYPNFEYVESRNRVFSRKPDMIKDIIRACAPRIVEEQIFGRDHISWISGSALAEAGATADFIILRTGMSALGKIHYRTQQDLMIHLGPKVVALREEYMRYAVAKCSAILKEYRSALETLAELLLAKEVVAAAEIWDIFNKAPRIPQPEVKPIDEYGALVYKGRWGIYGVSLPGRSTFSPGNVGYVTYGAPRPQQLQVIKSETWKMVDELIEKNMENLGKTYEELETVPTLIAPSKQFL